MKWTKLKISLAAGAVLAMVLPVVGGVAVAHAQSFRTGNDTTVSAGETVDGSLYIAGKSVDIAGTVNGDVFCAGQTVNVSGTVNGDVICAGQTVRVSGHVDGSVRVAGQTVAFDGSARSLSAFGQSVTTSTTSTIDRDATVGGQDVQVSGKVGRDLILGSQTALVGGDIGRNIHGSTEHLTLASSARVGGNVEYTSANDLTRQSGAEVSGAITRTQPKPGAEQHKNNVSLGWFLFWLYLSLILFALLLVLIVPHFFERASNVLIRRPWWMLLTGFVASIVAPIAFFVLLVTVLGIPFALFALLVWLVLVVLSWPVVAFSVGRLLLRGRSNNAIWYMLLGSAILLLIYYIPFLGWVLATFAYWTGLGAVLWQLRGQPKPRYRVDESVNPRELPKKPERAVRQE